MRTLVLGVVLVVLRNDGNAHGRLGGFLTGKDASGITFDLEPDTAPILPGETRAISLIATRHGAPDKAVGVTPPIRVEGTLEIGDQKLPLDISVEP